MSNLFDEWDKTYDSKQMQKDVEEAAKNDTVHRDEVPEGTYAVYVKSMEIKATKNNEPMLAIQFKIEEGEQENRVIFANFMLNKPFPIHKCDEFLRSMETGINVSFESYAQYADVVEDILKYTEAYQMDFDLKYSKNKAGYSEYKIEAIYTN